MLEHCVCGPACAQGWRIGPTFQTENKSGHITACFIMFVKCVTIVWNSYWGSILPYKTASRTGNNMGLSHRAHRTVTRTRSRIFIHIWSRVWFQSRGKSIIGPQALVYFGDVLETIFVFGTWNIDANLTGDTTDDWLKRTWLTVWNVQFDVHVKILVDNV
jgi:hypothetical protein